MPRLPEALMFIAPDARRRIAWLNTSLYVIDSAERNVLLRVYEGRTSRLAQRFFELIRLPSIFELQQKSTLESALRHDMIVSEADAEQQMVHDERATSAQVASIRRMSAEQAPRCAVSGGLPKPHGTCYPTR